jgi:DNA-binding NarL/FixJ family response regulator
MPIDKQQPIINILLADDHSVVRAGIRQFLEQNQSLNVIAEAGNGDEACELISKFKPDVALLDIQMPGLNGIEVTRWIREQNLNIRVMILSAYDDIPFVQAAVKAGADGYMIKTADPTEIVDMVFRIFRGEKYFSADVNELLSDQQMLAEELNRTILSVRELEVLSLASSGYSNKQIAKKLEISSRTVQNHIANIFHSLRVSSRTEAVMKAMKIGLLPGLSGKSDS